MGNLLVQAMATGGVSNLSELRRVVANSFDLVTYSPTSSADWDAAFERFGSLL
jgi:hypothetical protein